MASAQTNSSGIGFIGVLTIVFIVLKLTHVINWNWWWVLSPLWVSGILFIITIAIGIAILFILRKIK